MKFLLLLISLSILGFSNAQGNTDNGEVVSVNPNALNIWQEYIIYEGVLIEYQFVHCSERNGNETWLNLRFTNTSTVQKEINWVPTWSRDDVCVNCNRLDHHEFVFKLDLEPSETLGEDVCISQDKRFYMFSHFMTVYTGMDEKKMTSFQLLNIHLTNN